MFPYYLFDYIEMIDLRHNRAEVTEAARKMKEIIDALPKSVTFQEAKAQIKRNDEILRMRVIKNRHGIMRSGKY